MKEYYLLEGNPPFFNVFRQKEDRIKQKLKNLQFKNELRLYFLVLSNTCHCSDTVVKVLVSPWIYKNDSLLF